MGVKQDRKFEELSVDGSAFRAVLDQARKRQEARVGLKAMIEEWGTALRDLVTRPGEIDRMGKAYRDLLRANGDPGADEQAKELELMLVEIRRRVEEGTLRISRKAAVKVTPGDEAAEAEKKETDQVDAADGKKPDTAENGDSGGGRRDESDPTASQAAPLDPAAELQQELRDGETGEPDDGAEQEKLEGPVLAPEPEPEEGEPEDEEPLTRFQETELRKGEPNEVKPGSFDAEPIDEVYDDERYGSRRDGSPNGFGPAGGDRDRDRD